MNREFRQAVAELQQAHEGFKAGHLTSVAHGRQREAALMAALLAMAASFGVQLSNPIAIDARGDLRIVALDGDKDPRLGAGKFGEQFANLLNAANPRTGVVAGATLTPDSGWCYMNHFDVERLVLQYFSANA